MTAIYPSSFLNDKSIDLEDLESIWIHRDIYVALLNRRYQFDIIDEKFDQIKRYEIQGKGYESGGQKIDNKKYSKSNFIGNHHFLASPAIWENSTFKCNGTVMYDGVDKSLLCYMDFGSIMEVVRGKFEIKWPNGGILVADIRFADVINNVINRVINKE